MSNWLKFNKGLVTNQQEVPNKKKKSKRHEISAALLSTKVIDEDVDPHSSISLSSRKPTNGFPKWKYVALDCEMVGIGLTGKQSALARCSIVSLCYFSSNILITYCRWIMMALKSMINLFVHQLL